MMIKVKARPLPLSITLDHDKNRHLTLNQHDSRHSSRSNQSTILVFREKEKARRFRSMVMDNGIHISNNIWSVENDVRNANNIIFKTKIKNVEYSSDKVFTLTPLDFRNYDYVTKLITYNISVLFLNEYMLQDDTIEIKGDIWTPPSEVVYYPSDVLNLYKI